MAKDKFDILGPLMDQIGQELVNLTDGVPNGIFMYVEIGDRWISTSLFKDEGTVVRYYDAHGDYLSDLLWDAWYAESDEGGIKRWSVMEYDIKDGAFEAIYKYPDEVDVEVMDEDRREAALRARYGDKPVVYPPPPEGAFELKLK